MSLAPEPAANEPSSSAASVPPNAPRASFVAHARVIGAITFVSRVLGLVREMIVARYVGPGPVLDAFKFAFSLPNLFRKLLGEGALSAAFIPLYGRAVRNDHHDGGHAAGAFASSAVAVQLIALLALTALGEAALFGVRCVAHRPETRLGLELSMVMLPYVIFVCAAALLGGILQVHRRFVATAATSVILNLVLIAAIVCSGLRYDLGSDEGRRDAIWSQSISVVVAGVAQVLVLLPSLRACGFRWRPGGPLWTPEVRRLLRMTVPVALSLGVLQLGVVLDKQISWLAAPQSDGSAVGHLFGVAYRLPMAAGALSRLDVAQVLYQFPLGVFGVAIATAIFPQLSGDAQSSDLAPFRAALSRGITASMWIGLPASVGMALVVLPAVRLLFENGRQFTHFDAVMTARSTAIYSAAIWAFSVQQIINRGYYALHDMRTPLLWGVANLLINLVVEVPLLWVMGESAMAVGTAASFAVQTTAMTVLLSRRVGLPLGAFLPAVGKMLVATLGMTAVASAVRFGPHWPASKPGWVAQVAATAAVGAAAYVGLCLALRLPMEGLIPARFARRRA